jgi:hypothetical protein
VNGYAAKSHIFFRTDSDVGMIWHTRNLAAWTACSIVASSVLFLIAILGPKILEEKNRPVILAQLQAPMVQYYTSPLGTNLVPGASTYYSPRVKPIGPSFFAGGDPMGEWSDIFQRVTSELATDTIEIANLDAQERN